MCSAQVCNNFILNTGVLLNIILPFQDPAGTQSDRGRGCLWTVAPTTCQPAALVYTHLSGEKHTVRFYIKTTCAACRYPVFYLDG